MGTAKNFFYGRVICVAHLLDSAIQEIDGYFTDAELVRVDMGLASNNSRHSTFARKDVD